LPRHLQCLLTTLLGLGLVVLLGCGGGALPPNIPPGAPPVPTPSDPWYGTAGNVLISDRGSDSDGILDFLWIGFNSPTKWQAFLVLHQQSPNAGWICGRVVVDPKNPPGFYFDPETTGAAEATVEAIQTTLDFIKANPSSFAESGYGWCVTPITESIRDSAAP
jgi:hypothetical protein